MYYINITHRIPCTTQAYDTQKFFLTKEAMELYIINVFNEVYFHPDLCFISDKGKAIWSKTGVLIPEEK